MPIGDKPSTIILVILVLAVLVYAFIAQPAGAQTICATMQHGTVELQTTPKTTQYIIPVEYDAPFCGDVTMFVTEQGADTGLALATFSAHSTRGDGVLQIEINDRVPPNGIVFVGWMGVSDDGIE